jgi:flagellar assembly protein FliH
MTPFFSLLEPLSEPEPTAMLRLETADGVTKLVEDLAAQAREALSAADRTLANARAEAEEMCEDARVQAEALREAAWQEGFHDGRQTARAQIEAELRAQWDVEREKFRAEAEALIEEIVRQRQALWESQEAEMVAFSLDIARQVVKTELTQNAEIVTNTLHNALRRITDKENVRIRLSVADAPRIREMRDDLLTLIDGIKNLEIVEDRRVGDGGCVIETGAGTIDAKIETQLAEVERALEHAVER